MSEVRDHHAEERARDQHMATHKRNTARFFTENRHIAWVALIATIAWGAYGYAKMPKAKDPTIEVRVAVASCTWPGAEAEKVEQLVTRKIEQKLAENANIEKIESISRTSVAIVYVTLKEEAVDRAKEWDNIQGRLDSIHDLPQGAGPIQFQRDFGDTATLMLTVASPQVSAIELQLRAAAVDKAITAVRAEATGQRAAAAPRATMVISFPSDININVMRRGRRSRDSLFQRDPRDRRYPADRESRLHRDRRRDHARRQGAARAVIRFRRERAARLRASPPTSGCRRWCAIPRTRRCGSPRWRAAGTATASSIW